MKFTPPGSWRPESRDVEMMVCTAGHVDHGKTSLVKWLTGCETDVLKEEKERGMTIEPGFAPCSTVAGVSVGITDVPGHEKFVHHMVAGVSGVGMCILVIAADDGIMPQTIEHFQIMELLGVERGVVALTKRDLVDAATLEQRIGEIRAWLANGFLKDAPICPVSSSTGDGILEFHRIFSEAVNAAVRSEQLGIFRLPIERVFSMEGHGRVLSGVPVAGRIAEGDWVELVPGGAQGRVRGMQCFGRSAEQGRSGLCVALNVPDFARENPRRGQVLCLPGRLHAATVFHSRLRMLDRTGLGVKSGERVMLHTGTAEVQARVYGLELNYQQQLDFLPGVWSGLLVGFSGTWLDTEFKVAGDTFTLPNASDRIYSAHLGYERSGFSARVAAVYRNDYLDTIGDSADFDIYVAPNTQLDFSLDYKINKRWGLYFEASNLLDEPLELYQGNRSNTLQNELYGRTYAVGVKINL